MTNFVCFKMDKSLNSHPEHNICAHEIHRDLKSLISSGAYHVNFAMIFRFIVE